MVRILPRGRLGRWIGQQGFKVIAAALAITFMSCQAKADCDLPPHSWPIATPVRSPIVARDLVRLRDIGYQERPLEDDLFSLSPDGATVALILTQADPETNRYCSTLLSIDVTRSGGATVLDRGGDRVFEVVNIRGLHTGYGYPARIVPIWSPDGTKIAFLRKDDDRVRLWLVSKSGGDARPLTPNSQNVELFTWSTDGRSLIFATRPDLDSPGQEREGLSGYVFDNRMVPAASSKPATRLPVPYHYFYLGVQTATIRQASAAEADSLAPPKAPDAADFALTTARHVEGPRIWTAQDRPVHLMSPVRIYAADLNGRPIKCELPACKGDIFRQQIISLFWQAAGRRVLFLRKEGWAGNETALYAWRIGAKTVRRILTTTDLLASCQLNGDELLCLRESAREPRHLVSISLRSGQSRVIFDPNPELAQKAMGKIERLNWRNRYGLEVYGDLVLPPKVDGRHKLPLIVVQYRSRGFLRGGTGDEAPVFALAEQGFAVLNIDAPPPYFTTKPSGQFLTWKDAEAENTKDWAERWSKLSAVEEGVKILIDRGLVDPKRVGITGVSDGSTTAQFALINRPGLLAAAAIGTCCVDQDLMMIYGGPALASDRLDKGYPPISSPSDTFWQPLSLKLNAKTLKVPLLMQLADHEYLGGVASYMALREQGNPAALYVFPDEFHLKAGPAHRLAIYQRNIDWFRFWLQGAGPSASDMTDKLIQWKAAEATRLDP